MAGEQAGKNLLLLLLKSTLPNLFDSHLSLQFNGYFDDIADIAEMMVQRHKGFLRLLLALLPSCTEGNVTGLRARGVYTVDQFWHPSGYVAHVIPEHPGVLAVWGGQRIAHGAGQVIRITASALK